jgi:hypothetical protein
MLLSFWLSTPSWLLQGWFLFLLSIQKQKTTERSLCADVWRDGGYGGLTFVLLTCNYYDGMSCSCVKIFCLKCWPVGNQIGWHMRAVWVDCPERTLQWLCKPRWFVWTKWNQIWKGDGHDTSHLYVNTNERKYKGVRAIHEHNIILFRCLKDQKRMSSSGFFIYLS